jgi:hypothetical protein
VIMQATVSGPTPVMVVSTGAIAYTYIGYAGREAAAGRGGAVRNGLIALGLLAAVVFLPRLIRRLKSPRSIKAAMLKQRLELGEGAALSMYALPKSSADHWDTSRAPTAPAGPGASRAASGSLNETGSSDYWSGAGRTQSRLPPFADVRTDSHCASPAPARVNPFSSKAEA